MNAEAVSPKMLASFGKSVEERIIRELKATPSDDFAELLDIKNLAGDSAGHVRVYEAEKLYKFSSMSVNVMPGGRYFNMHVQPEARFNVPRFGFEGMVTTQVSQISMDFYPDMDVMMRIKDFLAQCGAVVPIFDQAKKDGLPIQASRLAHMRAFCSPLFLNSTGTTPEQLPKVEAVANAYLDEWLKIFHAAEEVSPKEAVERQQRRTHFIETIIELDPDRDMIVQFFGEETTDAIENAMMR